MCIDIYIRNMITLDKYIRFDSKFGYKFILVRHATLISFTSLFVKYKESAGGQSFLTLDNSEFHAKLSDLLKLVYWYCIL